MDSFIHKQPQKSKGGVILTRQSRDAVKLTGGKSQLSESLERVWYVYGERFPISCVVGCKEQVWVNHFPPVFKKW